MKEWMLTMCAAEHTCTSNNGGCSGQATCTDTYQGVRCTCKPGYTGDGRTCTGEN